MFLCILYVSDNDIEVTTAWNSVKDILLPLTNTPHVLRSWEGWHCPCCDPNPANMFGASSVLVS